MKKALIGLFVLLTVSVFSQNKNFDSLVTEGINKIYNIKLADAKGIFTNLNSEYPDHPAGKFFLAMIDWWKILLDIDNESYDDLFYAKIDDVIDQCDEILKKDPDNVDALFFKGGAIGFRGRLRALRDSWIKAADDGREAMPLVNEAYKLDPNNVDVKLGFGIYNYYASVIPEKYPFIKPIMVFFPKGDKQKGIKELQYVSTRGKYTKTESKYFLMTLYYQFEENYLKAGQYADDLVNEYPDNPLFQRYLGRITIKKGDYNTAAEIFSEIFKRCEQNYTGYNIYAKREASYYIGFQKKMNGQVDSAIIYFKQCADMSKKIDKDEQSGFMVNSILYLGMLNDQLEKRDRAVAYYKKLLDIRDYGDSHQLAKRYLEKPYRQ